MKRRTFYHLTLLLPYAVLVMSLGFVFLTGALDNFFNSPTTLEIFAGVVAFFAITGFVWGPLYTWMVILMLLWGRGRKTEEVRLLYVLSPVLLACSMGIPAVTISLPHSMYFLLDGFLRMNNMGYISTALLRGFDVSMESVVYVGWFFMAGISIVVGYAFVGMVVWVEKMINKRGGFKDETVPQLESPPSQTATVLSEDHPVQQTVDDNVDVV